MRLKIIFIIVLLLSMAALPLAVSKNFSPKAPQQTALSKAEITEATQETKAAQKNTEDNFSKEKLCGLTAALYRDNYNQETLKAIAIILNTNHKLKPESFDFNDKTICIYESEAENSLKENYEDIITAVDEVYEKTLCQNGKAFYIPYSYLSDGTTEKNQDYPYLQSVASPWDCYSDEYDNEAECVGVSLYGLNYLCEQGCDYSSALKWYLADFEIEG